jgi:predicted XRE-type DNA-binding protein
MSTEYDLKKSEKIGQLYPILVDAEGNVIDGFHRIEADPNWRREKLPEIDTEEKLLLARCVANWHRRQVSREEKEKWINGLARIYKKQDCANVAEKIADVTGLGFRTVHRYLNPEYKQKQVIERVGVPRTPASDVIRRTFDSQGEGYGERIVERHREEVEQDLRPKIEREIRLEVEEEVKKRVETERDRIEHEAVEKARQEMLTSPESMQEILERYQETKIEMQITPPPKPYKTLQIPLPAQYQHQRIWNLKQIIGRDFSIKGEDFHFDFLTLGYSQKSMEDLCNSLEEARVSLLIDVRKNPRSRYRSEFNKQVLAEELEKRGIDYEHMPELGIPRDMRDRAYKGEIAPSELFELYSKQILTEEKLEKLESISEGNRTFAIMCTEVDPTMCHRHRIALALTERGKFGYDL